MRLLCADAPGRTRRDDLVADRADRRGRPADPVRQARRARRRVAGRRHERRRASPAPGSTAPIISGSTRRELAALAGSVEARLLRLGELDPVLDEDGRLGWGSMAERRRERADLPRPRRRSAAVRAAGPGRAGPAGLVGLRPARPDGGRGRRDLGRRPKPDRMAQPPSLLRRAAAPRRRRSAAAGGGAAAAAASSISRASIRS